MATPVLPAELLSTIFSFLLDPYSYGRSYHKQYAFSQVCRSWRAIALADPTLWRVLKPHTPHQWVPTLIQRSRGSNLNVELRDSVDPDTLQAITTHFSAIGTLRVRLVNQDLEPSLLHEGVRAIATQELPLRVLDAASTSNFTVDSLPAPTPLDEDLAAIIARSSGLQELSFSRGINFLWNVPLPSSLTKLHLNGVERPSLKAFLDVLRQTPHLQRLYLGTCGPKNGSGPLPPISTHRVDLPCITSVRMGSIHLAMESFLEYLNFPAKRVDLTFENGRPPLASQSVPVIRYIADRFDHPEQHFKWPAPRQLCIAISSGTIRANLGLSPSQANHYKAWKAECRRLEFKHDVGLVFQWPNGDELRGFPGAEVDSFFTHLSRDLPLRNLEALKLEGPTFDSFTPDDFVDLLSNLQELVYLEAYGLSHSLWQALEEMQRESQQRFLPKLRYVRVDMKYYDDGDANEDGLGGLDWIQEWLMVRGASDGLKLVRLELAYWEWEGYGGAIPGFEDLADVVVYSNYDY